MAIKFSRSILLLILLLGSGACLSSGLKASPTVSDSSKIKTEIVRTAVAHLPLIAQQQTMGGAEATLTEAARLEIAIQTVIAQMTLQAEITSMAAVSSPTSTPLPVPLTHTPQSTQLPDSCDRADIIADLSIDYGNPYYSGQSIQRTWRLQNVGSCAWTPEYSLVLTSLDLQGFKSVAIPDYLQPGQFIDISTTIFAPTLPGRYEARWSLQNAKGELFGFGPDGLRPMKFVFDVLELGGGIVYDFSRNYCSAQWRTGLGSISCDEISQEYNGLVVLMDFPIMESGAENGPALWTLPNDKRNGWIEGAFPFMQIQPDDRLVARLGCLASSPGCDVLFNLQAETLNGDVIFLGQWREVEDGVLSQVNLDLSFLAGQYVSFIFTVTVQNDQPFDANAVWLTPVIIH